MSIINVMKRPNLPFNLLLIFVLFEYGRPQAFFPAFAEMYPGWVLYLSLLVALITTNKLFNIKNIQTKLFIALLILMTFHGPLATNNYWAYQIWRTTILNFIFYMSVFSFVDSLSKLERFINFWIVVNLVCAMVGIKNGGRVPNSAFMGDENDFCLVMNMALPFAYCMFLETSMFNKKMFYLTAAGIFIGANISSSSRGGFIGLVPVIFYCWYKTPKKFLATIIVLLLIGVVLFYASSAYWDEMRSIKEENIERGTGAIRWYYWKMAVRMFLDYPLMGIGQGNFPWVIERYEPAEGFLKRRHGSRFAHSLYFTLLSELGLFGVICFLGMLFKSVKDLKKVANSSCLGKEVDLDKLRFIIFGWTGALIGYLVSGMFLSVLYYPHFWLLIGFSIALTKIGTGLLSEASVKR